MRGAGGGRGLVVIVLYIMCRRLKQWYDIVAGAQLTKEQSKQLGSLVKENFDVSIMVNNQIVFMSVTILTIITVPCGSDDLYQNCIINRSGWEVKVIRKSCWTWVSSPPPSLPPLTYTPTHTSRPPLLTALPPPLEAQLEQNPDTY